MYSKQIHGVPAGYAAWEAAGLRWLAAAHADGGARVVEVHAVERDRLDLEHLTPAPPTAAAARAFGAALARTHAAGAPAWGSPPQGWDGDGWLGPMGGVLDLPCRPAASWGVFWAEQRIGPLVATGRDRGLFTAADTALLDAVCARAAAGDFDTADPVARLHGDLWAGNLMWTADGVVLIDPAAHGGHRETDLAMLILFGCKHLSHIVGAYDEAVALVDGWQERIPLHQLHPLLVHALLFGGGYRDRALGIARRYA